ncbi:hypothetical protein [Streptomyces odontomachi]|uniref:hypothetical protein n=1 Tax=Streptomyces odontomachi TaxID=2944940 RepID=UPI00210CFAAB|nr:hypothetical protein [Streptomyces sp. ODS25]
MARVSTLTYSSLLIGPVVVGRCADAFGLTATLAGTLVLLAGMLGMGLRAVGTARSA